MQALRTQTKYNVLIRLGRNSQLSLENKILLYKTMLKYKHYKKLYLDIRYPILRHNSANSKLEIPQSVNAPSMFHITLFKYLFIAGSRECIQ